MLIINFGFLCVGRGVLQNWGCRYRKTRSNFRAFCDFCAVSGKLGVDIIYWIGWMVVVVWV